MEKILVSIKNKKINVLCVGSLDYPYGMAGTKRLQHVIDGIKTHLNISVRIVILRQKKKNNKLSGIYRGVYYETVMGDLLRARLIALFPVFNIKTILLFRKYYDENAKNIIYHYGPPTEINTFILKYARSIGYKIIFDIVEDYDYTNDIAKSFYSKIRISGIKRQIQKIRKLASGIIVISNHLSKKYKNIVNGDVPLHYQPVSVDMNVHPVSSSDFTISDPVTLFYSGSFGKKDGVLNLIAAFDLLAEKNKNIRLVLTGKASHKIIASVKARINRSPYQTRIDYKGYLDDKSYFTILQSIDIPCMVRVDTPYANAGFPFKLGEYLASGKPVVASRISDVEKMLKNRLDVMLVKPGVIDDIVHAVEYLMNNPEAARAIGYNGRRVAKQFFDYKKQGNNLIDFFGKI